MIGRLMTTALTYGLFGMMGIAVVAAALKARAIEIEQDTLWELKTT